MRKSVALLACCLLLVGPATRLSVAYEESLDIAPVDARTLKELRGKNLQDMDGESLGNIDKIVAAGLNQYMAVINLKDTRKKVLIPINQLMLSTDSEAITTALSREDLESLPDYDPADLKITR